MTDKKECPYCFEYKNGKRICGAVRKIDCITEDFTQCVLKDAVIENENLQRVCVAVSERGKELKKQCEELEQANKILRFLQYVQREIDRYIDMCDLCGGSESCTECPNKNCADFCRELKARLE